MAALYAGMSYEEVVCTYSSTVTGVCLMRLQNYSDAEDCFQNTFVRLLLSKIVLCTTRHNTKLYPSQVFGHFQNLKVTLYCNHSREKAEKNNNFRRK